MPRNSISLDLVDAMVAELKAHDWTSTTPEDVLDGPIPPGFLGFPVIGVLAGDAEANRDHTNAMYADVEEGFIWELAQVLTTDDVQKQWRQHVEWRSEAVRIARKAKDNYWGLSGGVGQIRSSIVTGWEPSIAESPLGTGGVQLLLTTTIRLEVGYREQYT